MLRNLPSLDLLSSRNESTLWRPFFGGQDDGLQDFHGFETILLADCITFLQHQSLYSWIVAQFGKTERVVDGLRRG